MTPGGMRRIRRLLAEAEGDEEAVSALMQSLSAEGAIEAMMQLDDEVGLRFRWYIASGQTVGES